METLTKVLIGVGAAAAALTAVGLYEAHVNAQTAAAAGGTATAALPAVNPATVSATTPYTQLTSGSVINPGGTYLISLALPSGQTGTSILQALPSGATGTSVSPSLVTGLAALGLTLNQVWAPGSVPSNWPTTDTDSTRVRASVTYNGTTAISLSGLTSLLSGYTNTGSLGGASTTLASSVTGVSVFSTGS